jgi:diguanylate cyclase (GGDEF)-like protein
MTPYRREDGAEPATPPAIVIRDFQSSARANAEVLLWQGRVRIAVAILAGGVAFMLAQAGILRGHGEWLLGAIVGYVGVVGCLGWLIRRTGRAGNAIVGTTVLSDLVFIFVSTIASSPAGYYGRILILSFFVLHLTESHFGRKHATVALVTVVTGYLVTTGVMIREHPHVRWVDELWSVGLFTIAAVAFILQYGSFRGRLEHIVELFEDAEEGDFTKEYDLKADRNPDAVTRVGLAYNRVRLQLASMVHTDPLTGCLNRRGLDQAMAREVARTARSGSDISLLAVDLDHFKDINDTYGHITGDVVLREFGGLLVQTARAGDMVARTGGEEFSILLPDTDPSGAFRAAIRVCDTVRAHPFMVNGKRLHITISVGVVSTNGATMDSAEMNMKERADQALYAAKRGGRDGLRVWNPNIGANLTPATSLPVVSV